MYIGSVRFYKHLLLLLLTAAILVPTVLCVFLGMENVSLKEQAALQSAASPSPSVSLSPSPSQEASPSPSVQQPEPSATLPAVSPEGPEYQQLYPELYAHVADRSTVSEEDTVYLTFEDGPSIQTGAILAALEEADVKATFFVNGGEEEPLRAWMEEIAAAGHTIGMHSYSHDYQTVYTSVEAFLEDYDKLYRLIYEATGTYPEIFRFPGGSVNAYNSAIYQEIIAEMTRRGFVYFDWNVSGEDGTSVPPGADEIIENVTTQLEGKRRAIVQLHGSAGRKTTVEALPRLIEACREMGYSFAPLTGQVVPIVFGYPEEG